MSLTKTQKKHLKSIEESYSKIEKLSEDGTMLDDFVLDLDFRKSDLPMPDKQDVMMQNRKRKEIFQKSAGKQKKH
jgi:hypothetical protein